MSESPRYWQVAAGDEQRDYAQDFLRFGIAFVGREPQKLTAMREVAVGDRMVLKRGMSEIISVGEVVQRDGRHHGENDKSWLLDFDGWELPAYCYVDWRRLPKTIKSGGLTRGTIRMANQPLLHEQVETLLRQRDLHGRDPEPAPTEQVSDEQILYFLVQQGLRAGAADDLTATFNRIRLLARYYHDNCHSRDVREHETRTFLVIPLLLALGWAEQQLKIELSTNAGGRIDIACFDGPCVRDHHRNCKLIVETKGFSQGLEYAGPQARGYAKSYPECRTLLVTNGYCYKAYAKGADGLFDSRPSAYLNLLKPHAKYPRDPEHTDGCLEILRLLLPST